MNKGILLSHKKNKFESVLVRWMNIEPITQSEVSQKEKNKHHILIYLQGRNGDTDIENKLVELIGKDSDAGRDWGQEGTTEDEMAGCNCS